MWRRSTRLVAPGGRWITLASFRQLLNVDPGFKTLRIPPPSTSAPRSKYTSDAAFGDLMSRSLEAIRGIPGVSGAGATSMIPLHGDVSDSAIFAEGYQMNPGVYSFASAFGCTPGRYANPRLALVRVRYFDERDKEGSPRLVS